MKDLALRKLSKTIEKTMSSKGLTPKELAKVSGVSYSSLTPILNGNRDFGVSKLIAIAKALGCSTDELLNNFVVDKGKPEGSKPTPPPKYIAAFISVIAVTYCMLYQIESDNKITSVLQFPLRCGQDPNEFLDHTVTSIQKLAKDLTAKIDNNEVAVYVSVQQYGRATNRKKIQQKGDKLFAKFIMEADAMTNHKALLGNKNGICISINDGNVITYSTDKGKNISKLQGYGFPISDVAGNYWLGCAALKHAINVKEQVEAASLLSDKILALFNDDIDLLSECTMQDPGTYYSKASSIVKELMHKKQKSYEIIQESASLVMKKVELIDKETKNQLPIVITGDLAYIYEEFFPANRRMSFDKRHSTILLNYNVEQIKKSLAAGNTSNKT